MKYSIRLWAFITMLLGAVAAEASEPFRVNYGFEAGRYSINIPTEVYVDAPDDGRINFKVAGNLGELQRAIPGLLSMVILDTCTDRVALEVSSVRAEGDDVRAIGRIQAIDYRCPDPEDVSSRRIRRNHIIGGEILLRGRIVDNCLHLNLAELRIKPTGLAGFLVRIDFIANLVENAISEALEGKINTVTRCLSVPPVLSPFEPNIASGGFRDFESGTLGYVVKGTLDLPSLRLPQVIRRLSGRGRD